MIYSVTGHRPNKLDGYSDAAEQKRLTTALVAIAVLRPELVYTGMALGWDTAVAIACKEHGIPFVAAVPFEGQECMWPCQSQQRYHRLLKYARDVVYVCDPGYSAWKMQRRNQYMVDAADSVIALWDGTSGGTANCVHYAESAKKPIHNMWEYWVKL
jgi:uncharacterized phage-like protein YoqJ